MADQKLTDLTLISSINTGSLVYIVDGNQSYRGNFNQLANAFVNLYSVTRTFTGIGAPTNISASIGAFYLDVPVTGFWWKVQGLNTISGWTQLIG